MDGFLLATATALWLGLLTSISPCPLATNIAAISFVGRHAHKPRSVFLAGTLYTLGRALTHALIGILLVYSLLSAPSLSHLLQKYMNLALGPLMILVGMILLELITLNFSGPGFGQGLQKRVESLGIWGAGLLGIVFSLSFCPTSAALFFGSLIPLAVQHQSGLLLPGVYGIATGLPVLFLAVLLGLGAQWLATAFNRITVFERWARRITGGIFILLGIYYCLTHNFGWSIWD